MTKDFRLKHRCPHRVEREWRATERDNQTLRTARNPSSSKAVELYINDQRIPKDGLRGDVEISGRDSGPFDIDRSNDTFKFQINSEPVRTLDLPHGINLSAEQIADHLDDQTSKLDISSERGFMQIEVLKNEKRAENAHNLFLKGGSSHETLGLPEKRFYDTPMIRPGWSITKDPFGASEVDKLIYFDQPLRTRDDVIEVSYQTIASECRRCMGLKIEDDIRFDSNGQPEMIDGLGLLIQEVEKIVFTEKGSNVFHPWYGTEMVDQIGTKITESNDLVKTQLRSTISQTLDEYKDIKQQQAKIQPVSNQEFLLKVKSIIIEQDPSDPTVFDIQVHLMNKARQLEAVSKKAVIGSSSTTPKGVRRVR